MAVSDGNGPEEGPDARRAGGVSPTAGFRSAADDDALHDDEGALETDRLALDSDDPPLPWLQGDDDDEEFEQSAAGQTVAFVVLGLLAIALLIGGVWWVMRQSGDTPQLADGSTIEAPDKPYKKRPENPGGKVFEGTGDTSYQISEGQDRPARLGGESPAAPLASASPAKAADSDSASEAPAAQAVSGIGVQVAAYSRRDQAESGWTRLFATI